jgi:IBR domain, a half RING-finger domain/Zinc finger C-x8-C-x5-C-x3-H type (and similar)/RNA recognition motif. (a.k.a. RRM, RBD, or RNP domain)
MSGNAGSLRASALEFMFAKASSFKLSPDGSCQGTPPLRLAANEFVPDKLSLPARNVDEANTAIGTDLPLGAEDTMPTMNPNAKHFRPGCTTTSIRPGSLSLHASAACFVPQPQGSKNEFSIPVRSTPICRFFRQGACRRGLQCTFSHDITNLEGEVAGRTGIEQVPRPLHDDAVDKLMVNVTETLIVVELGIHCHFGAGLEVLKLKLGSLGDSKQQGRKSVLISGLDSKITDYDLEARLSTFGSIHSIHRKHSSFAYCSYESTKQAADAVAALDGTPQDTWSDLAMKRRQSSNRQDPRKDSGFVSVQFVAEAGNTSTSSRMSIVKVQCYAPSRVAWLHFHTKSKAEKAANACHMKLFSGHMVSAKLQIPDFNQTRSFSVWLGGLGEAVSTEHLSKWVLKQAGSHPASIDAGAPSFRDQDGASIVRQLLILEGGPLTQFDEDGDNQRFPHSSKRKALAKFTKVEDAVRACDYFQRTQRVAGLGGTKVHCQRVFSSKYTLPEAILSVVQDALIEVFQSHGQGLRYRVFHNSNDTSSILVQADDAKTLAIAKNAIGGFVDGQLVLDPACKRDQKIPLWRECFGSKETEQSVIDKVRRRFGTDGAVVLFQKRRREVRLFAKPSHISEAKDYVATLLCDIKPNVQAVPIGTAHFKFLVAGGRDTLDSLIAASYGTSISLNLKSQSLLVEGTPGDARRAVACLNKMMNRNELAAGEADPCHVCFCHSENEASVRLFCEHSYCRDCLRAWLCGVQTCNFPIRCLADGCNKAMEMEEMEKILPRPDFLCLMRSAVDKHVMSNQASLQFCLSPGCSGIYEVPASEDADQGASRTRTATCSTCQMLVCSRCQAQDHQGMTCEQSKLAKLPPNRLRNHIIEEVLTLKCPCCKQAFLDFDGCFALKCGTCPCGFCGWCLTDCGSDAHAHVKSCPSKPKEARNETYYGTKDQFEEAQRQRRRMDLKNFLQSLNATEKEQTLKALAQDLKDLNLTDVTIHSI